MSQDNARWSRVRPVFSSSPSSSSFLVRALVRDGRAGQFLQVVRLDSNNRTVLSLGTFTVNNILAWDSDNNTV